MEYVNQVTWALTVFFRKNTSLELQTIKDIITKHATKLKHRYVLRAWAILNASV